MPSNVSVEITGKTVFLKVDDQIVKKTTVAEFLGRLSRTGDLHMCDDPLPDGVRFVHRREDHTLVVVEMRPQVRQISWLADESPVPYGRGAIYQQVRLAFPYIVLFILFVEGAYTGYQRCYYRVAPIASPKTDGLLFPNLRNCADLHGLNCWLCLGHREDTPNVTSLPWNKKVTVLVDAFWTRGFNKSPDIGQDTSYWTKMQKVDPRVATIEAWQKATAQDPTFPLNVRWEPARQTVEEVMKDMLNLAGRGRTFTTSAHLVDIVNLCQTQE